MLCALLSHSTSYIIIIYRINRLPIQHSELLFDVVSHDIGNYHQILLSSLEVVSSLFRKNNNNNDTLLVGVLIYLE